MKKVFVLGWVLLLLSVSTAIGQLRLVPVRGTSKVKLISRAHTATVDLEDELSGTNGSLPGDPPHVYRVLFTAEKDGFLYLIANVRSHSPISDKNAPCGGDIPQSILWIKTDKTLKDRKFQSEIYESCSYNYYDSKVQIGKTVLTIKFGAKPVKVLTYDNREPQRGLVVGETFINRSVKTRSN